MRWCSASRAPGQRSRDLGRDPLERLQRQRLVRLVLEIPDAPPEVVVAHQAEKRHDRAVAPPARRRRGDRRDERLELERLAARWPGAGVTVSVYEVRQSGARTRRASRSDRAARGRGRWPSACAIAPATYALRARRRVRAARGRAPGRAAIADANVQPVPCVWRDVDARRRGARGRRAPSNSRSTTSASLGRRAWPPVMMTARGAHARGSAAPPRARRPSERMRQPAQRLGFRDVRRHDERARQQLGAERAHAVLVEQALAARRRPSPDRRRRAADRARRSPRRPLRRSRRWRACRSSSRASVDVAGDRFDLRGHEIGRQRERRRRRPSVFWAVIGGDRARAVHAERGERLQVRLDAGAAARVAARNCQRCTHTLRSALHVSQHCSTR